MKTPSRAPLIAAIVLVLAVLAGFNALNEKFRPKTEKEIEAAQAEAAQAAASKGDKSGEAAKAPTPAPSAAANPGAATSLAQLGPDATVGAQNGANTVTIGWAWTPDVQGDPDKVSRAIDMVKKAAPNAKIRVVNTDEVSGVPDGVSMDGKVVVTPAADGSFPAEASAYQGVGSGAGAKAPVVAP